VTSAPPAARRGPGRPGPWKKGPPVRRRHRLWPAWFWKQLADAADTGCWAGGGPSEACARMIGDMNQQMYGYRHLAFPEARRAAD
jgi:hypothetical protein